MRKDQHNLEEHFWIDSGGVPFFVCVHRAGGEKAKRGAFVMCPPFGEEKNKSQRLYVELARNLAACGFDVVRPDHSCTGDSPGSFEKSSIQTWRHNVQEAIRFCRNEDPDQPIGLLGLRFGAAMAATVAELDPEIKWLILLAPIADVPAFFRRTLRSKLVKEMMTSGHVSSRRQQLEKDAESRTIDMDGFAVTPSLYSEISAFEVCGRIKGFKGAILIVHASKNPRLTTDEKLLRDTYRTFNRNVSLVEVKAEPYWNVHGVPSFDGIIEAVVKWTSRKCHVRRWKGVAGVARDHRNEPLLVCVDRVGAGDGHEQIAKIDLPGGFLSGIVHVPDGWGGDKSGNAVVMVHGWAGYRIGPHQMLVAAAREFCRKGWLCLRIDARGRGNSSGQVEATDILSMREDAVYAVNFVREKFRADKVVALGQCRGGNAVLGAEEADGFVVWSAPPIDESLVSKVRKTRFMLQNYVAKAGSADTWWKLARGELNYALIIEAVLGHFKWGVTPKGSGVSELKGAGLAGKRTLMIYGENDPDTEPAEKSLMEFCSRTSLVAEFYTIPGANHSFYSLAWKKEVIDLTAKWLARYFKSPRND
ncbi:MAG: hypothetical protein C0404_01160 [Verrucomicrobia bacterium]|nr:hypothetical protein [Verrucomicrobiota bacterium]